MQNNRLLPARKYTERAELTHDGKVIVTKSNRRWCSDGLEFACWNGDIIRAAFIIDAHDREIIAWRAVSGILDKIVAGDCFKASELPTYR